MTNIYTSPVLPALGNPVLSSGNFVYTPPRTLIYFMHDNARVRFLIGPYGSGKTTGLGVEIVRRGKLQRPAMDGIRYTRWAIVRNTLQQIKSTVLKDLEMILQRGFSYKVTDQTVTVQDNDARIEMMLMPLDTPDDQRRLLSMQLTGVWLCEFREIDTSLVVAALGRCGRYPSRMQVPMVWRDAATPGKVVPFDAIPLPPLRIQGAPSLSLAEYVQYQMRQGIDNGPEIQRRMPYHWRVALKGARLGLDIGGATWFGLIGESNPPDEDSEWHRMLVVDKPPGWHLYVQPDGTSPEAENVENLPPGYYQQLIEGYDQDWVDVHVHGKWGRSRSGQAVYRRSFDATVHVARLPAAASAAVLASLGDFVLKPVPRQTVLIGLDFGRNPAAVLGQVDTSGRLLCFKELVGTDMGMESFASSILGPELSKPRWLGCPVVLIGDPSGDHRTQVNEETAFDILRKMGYRVIPASTNDIEPRIHAVESLLLRRAGSAPTGFLIDPVGCPLSIKGFNALYRYRRRRTGELEDSPDKTHPWSDLHDALQYLAMAARGGVSVGIERRRSRLPPQRVPPVMAWAC